MTDTTTLPPPPPPPPPRTAVANPTPAPARPGLLARLFRPVFEARTWKTTLQAVLDLPFGIAWFTVIVTGLSVGFGTLITLVGIPILLLLLLFSRVLSRVERARSRLLLDTDVPSPFRSLSSPDGLWPKIKTLLSDSAGWKALAFGLVLFPVGIAWFVVAVTVWSVALAGITYPIYGWALPRSDGDLFSGDLAVAANIVYLVLGLVVLVAAPYVMRGLAAVDRALVRALLGPSGTVQLQQRVEELAESREASVDAAEAERRRIERDLHDGAQQRLVALAMDLGLARERLERGEDAAGTAELIGHAHDEAKRAITELRELVRGIHPAVLADRGLDAALSSVAARCPVPVQLSVDLPERPPAPVEAAAYFVVTEALTNVAKHSYARQVWVRVVQRGPVVVVEITDDGVGGAVVHRSGGLAGLADRVKAVEGTVRLASPPGGPTTLLVELPCGS
jgi:signal transduction histidine kinase